MNKLLMLVLTLAMTSTVAIADNNEEKPAGGDRMARMQENLGLSDQQVAEMRRIRDDGGGRDQILAVLTDDQRAHMEQRRAEMKERGKGKGKGKGKGRKGGRPVPGEETQNGETADT